MNRDQYGEVFRNCELIHPQLPKRLCYIPAKPFSGLVCPECRKSLVDWGFWKTILWYVLWGWRWRGQVWVTNTEVIHGQDGYVILEHP